MMRTRIFLPVVGQYENIGDIILRRPLVDWLRPLGELHLFMGPAPIGYRQGLRLQPEDFVYESFSAWYAAGVGAALRGDAHYFFKPGEIQMTLMGMKEHVGMLPLLALLRLRSGRVVRLGSGARNFSALGKALLQPSLWLSQLVLWRDPETARFLGVGGVMPDLAFSELQSIAPMPTRDFLVVSMRGDRAGVTDAWIEGVMAFAADRGLSIVVVTQVLRDSALSRQLAERLGARLLDWDGNNHDRQETALREVYGRARVAVSDRLHVLIAACTHGAVPVALMLNGGGKVRRHFIGAGLPDIAQDVRGRTAAEVAVVLARVVEKEGPALIAGLGATRRRLDAVRKSVVSALTGASGTPGV